MQKVTFIQSHDSQGEGLFPHGKLDIAAYRFHAGIQGAEELVAASFYLKRDHVIIRYHDRPHIQVMGCHRGDHETGGIRKNNRAAAAQGISRGTGRRGYD